ncbi:hypothetical protein [Actinoplanes sp. NPDC051411]|uniref:hypothetical protein n=1 Tax=Actinoplanes sp. NPDC051411 TaxID=3155522 RepID=UPI00343DD49C
MRQTPARNRVAPTGEIIASPGRGAWLGNRGRLHEGHDIVRNHQVKAWLTCTLSYRDRRLPQWDPHHYTLLFFLDEAVAFAAGHRPCAECRRADYQAYVTAWRRAAGGERPRAYEMDARLHAERLPGASGRRHRRPEAWRDLPDGVFADTDHGPAVTLGNRLLVWDRATNTYGWQLPRPAEGSPRLITPPANVAVLRAGYPVQIGRPPQSRRVGV